MVFGWTFTAAMRQRIALAGKHRLVQVAAAAHLRDELGCNASECGSCRPKTELAFKNSQQPLG